MALRPPGGLGTIPLGTYGVLGGELELLGDWIPSEDPEAAADALLRVAADLSHTTALLLQAKELAVGAIERRFITETDPDGTPWVDLTEAYHKWKENRQPATPDTKLILDGSLFEAATSQEAWLIENDTLLFDPSGLPVYAGVHQRGGGNQVPARSYIGFDEEYLADIGFLFDAWVDMAVEGFTHPTTGVRQAWVFTPGGGRRFGPKL